MIYKVWSGTIYLKGTTTGGWCSGYIAKCALTPDFLKFSYKNNLFEVLFLVFFIVVSSPPHFFYCFPRFFGSLPPMAPPVLAFLLEL